MPSPDRILSQQTMRYDEAGENSYDQDVTAQQDSLRERLAAAEVSLLEKDLQASPTHSLL